MKTQYSLRQRFRELLFAIALITSSIVARAQGEIPVNMYTGTPQIAIPLHTLTDHDLSEPVALSYSTTGLMPGSDVTYGIGWNLTAGGSVSRQVRGLPDDYNVSGDSRKGWLYNSNYSSLSAFASATEANQQTFISGLAYNADTESDFYTFSCGGMYGHFVYSNAGAISLIPWQDVVIVEIKTGNAITGWRITSSAGVTYTFGSATYISKHVDKSNPDDNAMDETKTSLHIFDREYNQYHNTINYNISWELTKVRSYTNAQLTYTYDSTLSTATEPRAYYIWNNKYDAGGGDQTSCAFFYAFKEAATVQKKTLNRIVASTGEWVTISHTGLHVYEPARPDPLVKSFIFAYTDDNLTSVIESGLNSYGSLPAYQMSYNTTNGVYGYGVDMFGYNNGANNSAPTRSGAFAINSPTIYLYSDSSAAHRASLYQVLPYTGNVTGLKGLANRVPNANNVVAGVLTRLVYPMGGETDFEFESNNFWDPVSARDRPGGGLRIKTITYFNGIDPAANIVKNFTYLDASGHTSGRLVHKPQFLLPIRMRVFPTLAGPYTTYTDVDFTNALATATTDAIWTNFTVSTEEDISPYDYTSGSAVGYRRVTVSRPGSGYAVFAYTIPAVYGSAATGAGTTDFQPTKMKYCRYPSTGTMGIISGSEDWGYPFPSTYYDYERGLLVSKMEYNESNVLVGSTDNTYGYRFRYSTTPTTVTNLAYDRYFNSSDATFLFGQYSHIADVAKVLLTQTIKVYDENNTSSFSTSLTQSHYPSSQNTLYPDYVSTTNPDGTMYTTRFTYAKDYTVNATDSTLSMLKALQDGNRGSTPIEVISTATRPGGGEQVLGGSLSHYAPFTFSKPLLRYVETSRPYAARSYSSFVLSSGNGTTFTRDTSYQNHITQMIREYDSYEVPITASGEDKHYNGVLWGYNQRVPVAQFSDALSTGIAFSDFETTTTASFTASGYSPSAGNGRTGGYGLPACGTLTRTIVKAAGVTNYLLDFWLRNTAGSATINVIMKNTGGTQLSTNNYSFTLPGSGFTHFTKKIDVSSLPSTFVIIVSGSGFFTCTTSAPMLDDVAFYPDRTFFSSSTYDLPFGASSSTNAAGNTGYKVYDAFGNVRWVMNQNKDITQKNSWTVSTAPAPVALVIETTNAYLTGTPYTFQAATNNAFSGATYSWSFDGGTTFSSASASNISPSHTFSSIGSYTVSVRVIANGDTTRNDYNIVAGNQMSAVICGTGVRSLNNGVVTLSYNCFTNTSNTDYVTFRVDQTVNSNGGTLTYQWKTRATGTSTWTTISGSTAQTLAAQHITSSTTPFDVMCHVVNSDGRSVDSNVMSVQVIIP